MLVLVPPPLLDSVVPQDGKPWFLATILIAAIENCSGSGWREHGEIMCLNVDSIWGDAGIT